MSLFLLFLGKIFQQLNLEWYQQKLLLGHTVVTKKPNFEWGLLLAALPSSMVYSIRAFLKLRKSLENVPSAVPSAKVAEMLGKKEGEKWTNGPRLLSGSGGNGYLMKHTLGVRTPTLSLYREESFPYYVWRKPLWYHLSLPWIFWWTTCLLIARLGINLTQKILYRTDKSTFAVEFHIILISFS